MLKPNPRARLRHVPGAAASSDRLPSAVAQGRLTDALRDRADAYRADATIDLTLVDVLVRMDELEAAARTLDGNRASLQAMAHDLQVVVADAAVEREAEHVHQAGVRRQRPGAVRVGGVRRRLVALTGAAAVLVALLLPSSRWSPRTILTSVEDRVSHDEIAVARSRLDAARSAAEALRAARPSTTSPQAVSDPAVHQQVRAILAADEQGEPAAHESTVDAVTVLSEVRAARDRPAAPSRKPQGDDGTDTGEPGQTSRVIPLRRHKPASAGERRGSRLFDGEHDDSEQLGPASPDGPAPIATD